ncbi:hypothetical protein ENSA7_50680 [Enhygromyxa salina]|uniref:Glycogen phosphorylase n=2 Tax=Enhygromyxa salina TaxID=215803 RepID=A0A2S9YHJ1_9BACT|nr:hypothetical protein ENSA7_50680 [Enhygromyxa salina]
MLAYVCAEFAIEPPLGGFVGEPGLQAGDALRSASDQGRAMVAIGLLYRRVFVTHEVEEDGQFRVVEADVDLEKLSLERVNGADGAPLCVMVTHLDQQIDLGVWAQVIGGVRLLLLDTHVADNGPDARELCLRPSSPGSTMRSRQDALLGSASEPVLAAIGVHARVQHHAGGQVVQARVHLPSWTAADVVETLALGGAPIRGANLAASVAKLKPRALWNLRARAREHMIERLYARGLPAGDSDALWIGCAGRLGAGLRTDLLFHDLARLGRLLDDPLHAVRMVCSGAADPDDEHGQAQLAKLIELSCDPRFEGRIVFVPDWNLEVARILTEGVDLWLGTATRGRPGESWGIRAAANGGLNLSIAEGWWPEVASEDDHQLGWTLGGERMFDEQAAQDAVDSRMLFALLETEVVPSFYDWDGEAIPQRWVERVRASMRTIPAAFDGQR